MAPRSSVLLLVVACAFALLAVAPAPAAAQKSVRDVLQAVPDCAPFAAALQQYRPDVFTAIAQPGFNGTVLCAGSLALRTRPLPSDPAAAAAVLSYHILAAPLPQSPKDGEEFVTLLPNARVYASRRGGGPIVHLIGGEAPSSFAPLPVDNTASVLATEAPRGGAGKGVVALVDIVLIPPASAMPPASTAAATALLPADNASAPAATAALKQARVLAKTPTMPASNSTANGTATNSTGDVRVGAAGGPSIIPKKLKKQIVKVVRKLLP